MRDEPRPDRVEVAGPARRLAAERAEPQLPVGLLGREPPVALAFPRVGELALEPLDLSLLLGRLDDEVARAAVGAGEAPPGLREVEVERVGDRVLDPAASAGDLGHGRPPLRARIRHGLDTEALSAPGRGRSPQVPP